MGARPVRAYSGADRNGAAGEGRGGAWGNTNDQNFRCANRNDNDPTNVNTNNGFRLVARVSPLPGGSRPAGASGRACRDWDEARSAPDPACARRRTKQGRARPRLVGELPSAAAGDSARPV
jgi:hypothetical protein